MLNPIANFKRNQISPILVYKGVVVDNMDPDTRQRVRIRIRGVMDEFEADDHYPWAIPSHNHSDGSTKYSGKFDVPKIGSIVGVTFPPKPDGTGDFYNPKYGPYSETEPTAIKDGEHHYPNRKVERLQNGTHVIIDTEDDSVWFYNPGETHVKSKGKLCIKCEETFVIISDVEVGIRAPEVAIRAKDHLILESEDKLTMRCKGRMNIESRDDIYVFARLNVDMTAAEQQFRITTLSRKDDNGDILVAAKKDSIKVTAEGNEEGRKHRSDIKVLARRHDFDLYAEGRYDKEKSHIKMRSRKNDIILKAESENWKKERTKIEIINTKYNATLKACSEPEAGLLGPPLLTLTNGDGIIQVQSDKLTYPSIINILAAEAINIAAPAVNISVG